MKTSIYKAVIEPIFTCATECWYVSSKNKQNIYIFEMDILRRASRISRLQHIRNEEIRESTNRFVSLLHQEDKEIDIMWTHTEDDRG